VTTMIPYADDYEPEENLVIIPFKPRMWQWEVMESMKRFNVWVVHRGAGKSVVATNVLNQKAPTGPANADYAYILPKANQAARNVWNYMKQVAEVIPGVHFNNSTKTITYPNKARVMLLGANDPESLRGLHLHGVVLDEFADMHADTWTAVRPMLTNHDGWCIWIGTPKGENKFYDFYQMSQDPKRKATWDGRVLTYLDTGALATSEVEQLRDEFTKEAFEQELLCSWNASLVGAYYKDELAQARTEGRLLHGSETPLYRPDVLVNTAWDLGIRDKMAVWFYQIVGDKIHVIDYEEKSGWGLEHWADCLIKRRELWANNEGFSGYGTHWAPHDVRNRELGTGISRIEQAARFGIDFDIVPAHKIMDGINLARLNFDDLIFDMDKVHDGVKCLRHYKAKTDKYGNGLGPEHDWASHGADAFRYMIAGARINNQMGTVQLSGY